MREPIYGHAFRNTPKSELPRPEVAALFRATQLAVESALTYGQDLPVGAVLIEQEEIVGRGFANDNRFRVGIVHAEVMAHLDSAFDVLKPKPTILVSTLEPCKQCQDYIQRSAPTIKEVFFGLLRNYIAEIGLVNPHSKTARQRVTELGYWYTVEQVEYPLLKKIGLGILGFVDRDAESGVVMVDQKGMWQYINELQG